MVIYSILTCKVSSLRPTTVGDNNYHLYHPPSPFIALGTCTVREPTAAEHNRLIIIGLPTSEVDGYRGSCGASRWAQTLKILIPPQHARVCPGGYGITWSYQRQGTRVFAGVGPTHVWGSGWPWRVDLSFPAPVSLHTALQRRGI